MSSADGYIREIESISDALKRLNTKSRDLRKQKNLAKERLYVYMERSGITEYRGYKAEKLKPKDKPIRKKPSEKKADALRLFAETGITDPELFWQEFQKTQKCTIEGDDEDES